MWVYAPVCICVHACVILSCLSPPTPSSFLLPPCYSALNRKHTRNACRNHLCILRERSTRAQHQLDVCVSTLWRDWIGMGCCVGAARELAHRVLLHHSSPCKGAATAEAPPPPPPCQAAVIPSSIISTAERSSIGWSNNSSCRFRIILGRPLAVGAGRKDTSRWQQHHGCTHRCWRRCGWSRQQGC